MNNSYILYSRTKNNDYRWIYIDNKISQNLKKKMYEDYHYFEGQKTLFLNNNIHFIFHFDSLCGAVIYKFCKMDSCDMMGRNIYGLYGLFIDLNEIEMVKSNFIVYIYYFLTNGQKLLEFKEVDDKTENSDLKIQVSIDDIWEKYNTAKGKSFVGDLKHLLNDKRKIQDIWNDIYFPKSLIPSNQCRKMENQFYDNNDNKVDVIQAAHKPMFDHSILERKIENEFKSSKLICKECGKRRKIKTIGLDINSRLPICQSSNYWEVQIQSDEVLFACQCESCKSKYVISKKIKILDEWK